MDAQHAFIALNRFGYGPGPAGLAQAGADPVAHLKQQLRSARVPPALADIGGLATYADFLNASRQPDADSARARIAPRLRQDYKQFVFDLSQEQMTTTQPFVERLAAFWANHFTVSISKPTTASLLRDYQHRAIRPHVTGRFADMLVAVVQHPAWFAYLHNFVSFGRGSGVRRATGRGLNENLAREILELHTLGVDGGYSQADVLALAKIITGWTINRNRQGVLAPTFNFAPQAHEPGAKTLLGRRFAENGLQEGIEALRMLAGHPATARHLARKMATHFVSDQPPASLVRRLEQAYSSSAGDLGAMALALLEAPESWQAPLAKIKPTADFVIGAFRATGYTPNAVEVLTSFSVMDHKAFDAPSPQGYSDQNADWMAPGALLKRVEWAQEFARRLILERNPHDLAQSLFGPVMQESTAFMLRGAESAAQGLVLLLMSPEFQRR